MNIPSNHLLKCITSFERFRNSISSEPDIYCQLGGKDGIERTAFLMYSKLFSDLTLSKFFEHVDKQSQASSKIYPTYFKEQEVRKNHCTDDLHRRISSVFDGDTAA